MSNVTPDQPAEEHPRKALVIWWTPATNEIELEDMHGLSVFDMAGLLACALEIASNELPVPYAAVEEESD